MYVFKSDIDPKSFRDYIEDGHHQPVDISVDNEKIQWLNKNIKEWTYYFSVNEKMECDGICIVFNNRDDILRFKLFL